jgi:hypothetical protein
VTPLYPQKLALTSPTGGGRSVGIVRSRTKATEFFFIIIDADSNTELRGFWLDINRKPISNSAVETIRIELRLEHFPPHDLQFIVMNAT